jgi:Na+/proline symporter/signal transduction histidine kinase
VLNTGTILFASFLYMGLLFAIAYWGDKRADEGRSVIANSYIYTLSLAVYCTAWTFYGSVGMAVRSGPGFLTTYLGPTLMSILGWLVLRKIVRISKAQRITSIADFIASRYGKSPILGGAVTVIAVMGVIPYISLQLKAISTGFMMINQYPEIPTTFHFADVPVLSDTAFYVAITLAVFAILFGTRHLEATERHEGLVAAIAFESMVKLAAFLAVGIFATYFLHDGFAELFRKAGALSALKQTSTIAADPATGSFRDILTLGASEVGYVDWSIYLFLSMLAILFLPRQFQVMVVENVNEDHLSRAIWLFPLYLLAINIFVLPVALAGILRFSDTGNADWFVLMLPMAEGQQMLALFVYLGGMSAATGMVIVETIALSTMICNDLVMPVLIRLPIKRFSGQSDLRGLLLAIRRASIVLVLMMGYAYFHSIGEFYALVSIGLVSFAAVAQFAPSLLGGIFWRGGTRNGALSGLIAGFAVWLYTLPLPYLAEAGLFSRRFVTDGLFGIELLQPYHLFGLQQLNPISQSVFWSMLFNVGAYVGVSVLSRPRVVEHTQAAFFVNVFKYAEETGDSFFWRGTASLSALQSLLRRFLGPKRADRALENYARKHDLRRSDEMIADADLVGHAEKLLAGTIGSASARVMVSSVVKEEPLGIEEVLNILDETRQVIAYSRELEKATEELKAANVKLQQLDRLKDDFISTVSHELRTPLTSVRSLSEILHNNPGIAADQIEKFTGIILKESDRLIRLISQVLDYEKIESAQINWSVGSLNLEDIVKDAVTSTRQLINDKNIRIEIDVPSDLPPVSGDHDRLVQVMVNLISNAVKFCEPDRGAITVRLQAGPDHLLVRVEDNGIGIKTENLGKVFEPFFQIKSPTRGRPMGTGIGLSISKRIIDFHHGRIWVESTPGQGATFLFTLPTNRVPAAAP